MVSSCGRESEKKGGTSGRSIELQPLPHSLPLPVLVPATTAAVLSESYFRGDGEHFGGEKFLAAISCLPSCSLAFTFCPSLGPPLLLSVSALTLVNLATNKC